jgi:hypothetical protein
MTRYAKRKDGNHNPIQKALEKITVVDDISWIGRGFGDLMAEHIVSRKIIFIEIKDPSQSKSDRKLTKAEVEFHLRWNNHVAVVETIEEAFAAVGVK